MQPVVKVDCLFGIHRILLQTGSSHVVDSCVQVPAVRVRAFSRRESQSVHHQAIAHHQRGVVLGARARSETQNLVDSAPGHHVLFLKQPESELVHLVIEDAVWPLIQH